MMRYWMMCVIGFLMATQSLAQAVGDYSCLTWFDGFDPLYFDGDKLEDWQFPHSVHWYDDCFLINTGDQLALYDPVRDQAVQLVASSTGQIRYVTIRPHDNAIAFVTAPHNTVYLLDPNHSIHPIISDHEMIFSLSFSVDGDFLAVGSSNLRDDGYGNFFNTDALTQVFNQKGDEIASIPHLRGWDAVSYLAFASDGQHLLIYSDVVGTFDSDLIEYWDLTSLSKVWNTHELVDKSGLWSYEINQVVPKQAVFKGDLLAIYGHEGYMDYDEFSSRGLHIWDVERQERLYRFEIGGGYYDEGARIIRDMAFNPDATMLVTAQTGGLIRLWSMIDGELLHEVDLGEQQDTFYQITFNRAGDQFLVANLDTAVIFDATTLEIVAQYDLSVVTYTFG